MRLWKKTTDWDTKYKLSILREDIASLKKKMEVVEFQLSCGAMGHSFQLTKAWEHHFDGEIVAYGNFRCFACGLEYRRGMTIEEIKAARDDLTYSVLSDTVASNELGHALFAPKEEHKGESDA